MLRRSIWAPVVLSVALVMAFAPVVNADLIRSDPNDVGFKLDIRQAQAGLDRLPTDRIVSVAYFFERIPQRLRPRVNVQYDVFGTAKADFALRFRFVEAAEGGLVLKCRLMRLADGQLLHSRLGDADPRSLLCYMHRPGSWGQHDPVRWRMRAILPSRGHDAAPNTGWYPHA